MTISSSPTGHPARRLRALVVEDQPLDADLLIEALHRSGFEPEWVRVESESEYAARLDPALDVIFADFNLPHFDGRRAIELAVARVPEVPVIVTSGSLGDELAADCIKLGAVDYILKDRLARVGAAVERALAMRALLLDRRLSEERLRLQSTALEKAANAIVITAASGRIIWVNPAFTAMTGFASGEVVGHTPRILKSGVHSAEDYTRLWQTILAGKTWHGEFTNRRKDGSHYHGEQTITPVRGGDRNISHFVGIMNDVTTRKRSEESMRQFAALVECSQDAIVSRQLDGVVTSWNPAATRMFGYTADEMIGQSINGIVPADHANDETEFNVRLRGGDGTQSYETVRVRRDGSRIDVSLTVSPIREPGGRVAGASQIFRDITQRKRSEFRLQLEHAVTAVLAERLPLSVANRRVLETIGRGLRWDYGEMWTVDRNASVLRCLESWRDGTAAMEEFAAQSRQFTFAAGQGLAGRVWQSGHAEWITMVSQETGCPRRELAERLGLQSWLGFPVQVRNETLGVVGFFVSHVQPPDGELLATLLAIGAQLGLFIEREQLAEQFRQAQKMEAIGTLAGGIAHDFNNIITAVTGYAELARMDLGNNRAVGEHLDAVLKAAARAAGLVRQILSFSRHRDQERRPIPLHGVVAEAANLLRATIPTTIEFRLHLPKDLPMVLADPTQVHQVIMNLGTNAWHAMRGRSGCLEFRLEPCEVGLEGPVSNRALRPGRYLCLTMSDTGQGMDQATLSRVFEPFFTTKAPGEGTGLGLAVVHGIMQGHGGAVTVSSAPGQGTTFRLHFPLAAGEGAAPAAASAEVPAGHGERILFIDDEDALAQMGKKILERLGYTVDTLTNPTQALELLQNHPERYNLVVSDHAMPGLSGVELAQLLAALRPDLPLILITGFAGNLPERIKSAGVSELLLKPISVQILAEAVHRVLSAAREKKADSTRAG